MNEQKAIVIQMVEDIAMGLYQQDKRRGVEQMETLIKELLNFVKQDELDINVEKFNKVLVAVMNALEIRDYVLLADILSYDLKELLT